MNDYIDRQAAINALAKAMPSLTTPDGCGEFDHEIQIAQEAFVDAVQIIHDLPSAQPERKKGKWRDYPIADGCWQCSSCGVLRMGEPSNYCPNCGARMDLEE